MRPPVTLSLYVARKFSLAVTAALLGLTGFVALFDFIDLLRRTTGHPEVGLALTGGIALLRLPFLALQVLPFAVQLGGMFSFWRLTRSSELIVARAAGVSAWEFLAGPVLCAALFGAVATMAISPLSSAMFARANQLIEHYLSTGGGPLELNGGQLWLRQADAGPGSGAEAGRPGVAILHARAVAVRGGTLSGRNVTVFRLDSGGELVSRIDAAAARLTPGAWTLDAARVMLPDALPSPPAPFACRPILRCGGCRKASPPRTPCRSGNCRGSSRSWRGPASPRCATGCISRPCWRCRCSPQRWHWSRPAFPCARRGAGGWRG